MKVIELDRKNKKYSEVKDKERMERERRYERNMERLKRLDRVEKHQGKIDLKRSRKPMKIRFVKKVEPTEEELDYIRYVLGDNPN